MEAGFSDPLRVILLLIGVAVVFGVYLFSRRAPHSADTEASRTHTPLNAAANDARTSPTPTATIADARPRLASDEAPSTTRFTTQAPADGGGDERVLVLHVRATAGRKFAGEDILRIAERAKLKRASGDAGGYFEYFGEQQARLAPDVEARPLFYVANMFSPGLFDFQRMDSFSTTGLSLFAQLPGTLPADEIFDSLLTHARLFAEGLQGSILDENHNDVTSRTIRAMQDTFRSRAE